MRVTAVGVGSLVTIGAGVSGRADAVAFLSQLLPRKGTIRWRSLWRIIWREHMALCLVRGLRKAREWWRDVLDIFLAAVAADLSNLDAVGAAEGIRAARR